MTLFKVIINEIFKECAGTCFVSNITEEIHKEIANGDLKKLLTKLDNSKAITKGFPKEM